MNFREVQKTATSTDL